jgi:hypothetical protein
MNIVFEITTVLFVHVQKVFKFLACLVREKEFLLASLKKITNSKIVSDFFRSQSLFSPVYIHGGQLSEHFSESQAISGSTFRVPGGYRKAGTSSRVNFLLYF